jgi:hypothetical protein
VFMTTSEAARHVRAELETIAAGLQLDELVQLLALGRRLFEEQDESPCPYVASAAHDRAA